ncbi:hypothetical protein IFM89_006070 [Coptis chinensis]|uniref:GCF C-terminal domain-containing protein n=1 Tax=Coptis chinensis TaxID=261450 RepID=A0A835H3X0_9MAGN|nr:hypothetical protein IFM89_006070 [Coptis chinensis]
MHKKSYLDELEDEVRKLQEDRASAIVERRKNDSTDEMNEIEAAISAARSVLKKGDSSAAMVAAATAAQAAMKDQSNLPVELDEFGRDKNLQKRLDVMRRAEARKQRKAKADLRQVQSVGDDNAYHRVEGESSTDESDSESISYRDNRDKYLQVAEELFSDASEEYSQLSVVKERHSLLFHYGVPKDGSDFNADDPDGNLVPGLVEKIALPILHHQIAHCWDILSTRETKNAVYATDLVINYVPASSEALRELLAEIHTRFADAIAKLTVPTWTPLEIKAVPNAARVAAYQFGMSIRLLRNICLWKDILRLPTLEKLALDELLGGKILPHVRSVISNIHDAITRTERIIASMSGVWAGPGAMGVRRIVIFYSHHSCGDGATGDGVLGAIYDIACNKSATFLDFVIRGDSGLVWEDVREWMSDKKVLERSYKLMSQKLQALVDYVLTLGKTLEKKHMSGVSESETSGLARRLKKMLVELNEYDRARALARGFQLKEAL